MACYYCPDCNYLYRRKRLNCPYCSSPLSLHNGPEEELLAKGYRVAPIDQKLAPAIPVTSGMAADTAGSWPDHIEGWDDEPSVPTGRTGSTAYRTGTAPARHDAPPVETPEGHSFFDVPDPSIHADSIPGSMSGGSYGSMSGGVPGGSYGSMPGGVPGGSYDSMSGGRATSSGPARRSSGPRPITYPRPDFSINWPLLLRIGCILFGILCLIAVWVNRHLILHALFELLLELFAALSPLLFLIFLIWYIFFRRR